MDNFTIAFIIFFISILGSSAINAKAISTLNQTQKADLIDLFGKSRFFVLGVLGVILVLFFCSIKFQLLTPMTAASIYVFVLVGFFIVVSYLAYKKLKEHGFPDDYIKAYLLSTVLRLAGLSIFLLLVNI